MIVVIYVIFDNRPHQFVRTVRMLLGTGPSCMFSNVGSEKVCSSVNLPSQNGNNRLFVDVS